MALSILSDAGSDCCMCPSLPPFANGSRVTFSITIEKSNIRTEFFPAREIRNSTIQICLGLRFIRCLNTIARKISHEIQNSARSIEILLSSPIDFGAAESGNGTLNFKSFANGDINHTRLISHTIGALADCGRPCPLVACGERVGPRSTLWAR